MKRNLAWKFIFVVFVLIWSWYEMSPPNARDLVREFASRGSNKDATFNAIVEQAQKLQKENPDRAFINLRDAIGTNAITQYFPKFNVSGDIDQTKAILNRLQRESAGRIKRGIDIQGGQSFLVEMETNRLAGASDSEKALAQAVEVLRKRVDKFGVAEPLIQPVGNNRILIQLPGLSDADQEAARKQIQAAAFLEFRMVHAQSRELIAQGLSEPGYEVLKEEKHHPDGTKSINAYMVRKKPEGGLTGKNIKSARPVPNPMTGQPQINFELDKEGAKIFAQITRENIGRQMAIVLDGVLYSAPVIRSEIPNGTGEISGDYDIKEAYQLANVLENPLEAPVHIIAEQKVGASVGADAIQSGIRASIYGTIAVAGFMAIYYLFAGVVANVALLSNIVILLGVMCSVGTTLTLPGIAGIVLTVGMAVDANVLIFERIREESAKGKSLRGALAAGYDRAFGTIFDSHVTTLISSIILIFMGTGTIKGFGVALTIGVAASLFTALVVTRLIFDFLLMKGWLTSLPMLHLVRSTSIDFMKLAKPAFILSWTIILVGLGYGIFVRGDKMFGIDFAGGDDLLMSFEQKVESDKVREALTRAGMVDPMIQYQKDIGTGKELLRVTSAFGTGDKVASAITTAFPQAKYVTKSLDKVGPTIGKEIQKTAIVASLLSLFGILIYVAFRYEFSFAVGAVVAVLHDVLMTIGAYCLTGLFGHGREFNATMVAAVLTIIGFSINDTIVIFDRIREDLKLGARGSFKDLINQALNQTLSRTIITSGTVFLATTSLYIFGGGAINDFAYTFLVGIITGTYSSIYIASALVLWWHKGERPKTNVSTVTMDTKVEARV